VHARGGRNLAGGNSLVQDSSAVFVNPVGDPAVLETVVSVVPVHLVVVPVPVREVIVANKSEATS
jgi:hypothetical protein